MKRIYLLIAIALTGGCLNSPERVTRSTLDIVIGTNHIKSSTPKEYKIKKLQWNDTGFTVEGLDSSANVNAVEAQVQQAQMLQQGFAQGMQMLQFMSVLAAQHFGGGGNQPPQVTTNFVYVPISAINTITNK